MPTFYNYTENGVVYSLDDVLVSSDLFREGSLWAAGRNAHAQLGFGSTSEFRSVPDFVPAGSSWKEVSPGLLSSAAIKTDGTLWVWGNNSFGQLGLNLGAGNLLQISQVGTERTWRTVSSGRGHVAAIKTDGSLWTWGQNDAGQLGDNTIIQRSTPVTTFTGGNNWKSVSAGFKHTIATKTDGTLWAWGLNTYGALGNNINAIDASTPVTTFAGGNNWVQVTAGSYGSAAIKTDGSLWTWGVSYACGIGTFGAGSGDRSTPVTTTAGGNNWKQVSMGYLHASAIKTDGTLWTWGYNGNGQLGLNQVGGVAVDPLRVGTNSNWKQVACGVDHVAAIKTDGTLWVWGGNQLGQLGVRDVNVNVLTPVTTFAGKNNWKRVSAGHSNQQIMSITYEDNYP